MTQQRYFRKIIKISAEMSPNVRYARAQIAAGLPYTNEMIPGVISYEELLQRRHDWDPVRQCIGLDGEFYEGAEILLFPPEWLNLANQRSGTRPASSTPRWMGCDPAEGGDKSSWCVIDRFGILELLSLKTPDTTVIPNTALSLMSKYGIPGENVVFDRGGGGKQHCDVLNKRGHPCRSVAFGESIQNDPHRGITLFPEKKEQREDKYVYKNRRAELYGEFSQLVLDPNNPDGRQFAIPPGPSLFQELRRQLSVMPKLFDDEGRMWMLPKTIKDSTSNRAQLKKTLVDLIGHSPDEADSLVLAVHAMLHGRRVVTAGAIR